MSRVNFGELYLYPNSYDVTTSAFTFPSPAVASAPAIKLPIISGSSSTSTALSITYFPVKVYGLPFSKSTVLLNLSILAVSYTHLRAHET